MFFSRSAARDCRKEGRGMLRRFFSGKSVFLRRKRFARKCTVILSPPSGGLPASPDSSGRSFRTARMIRIPTHGRKINTGTEGFLNTKPRETTVQKMPKASRKALENSAVLLGYSSVEEHADVTSAAADITELFPTGTVSFANLKVLGPLMIDKAVVYGASLAEAGGSLTRPAFYKMLHGDGGMLMPVDDCRIEKNGGISGIVDGKFMLFGSRTLMEEHNVSGLPPENNEKSFSGQNPVCYLSVSGRAVMMFAVRLTPERSSVRWIQELASEKVLLNVSAADDFISAHRIAKCYGISPNLVRLFSPEGERIFDDLASPTDSLSASMFCTGHVSGFALLLVAAKRVRLAANLGTALQYGSMLLGIVVSLILMLMGAFSQLTATMVVLYHAAFMFIAEFIQGTKDI